MFEYPRYGAEAADLSVKVVKKARKTGITLLFLTQSPTATSIPKNLTHNCSNAVAYHVANDGLLGSGTYRQGIRATELRPGEDRSTAVTTGWMASQFELVNGFYITFDVDRDEITPAITRVMALLSEHDRPGPTTDTDPQPAVDHLADIHTALRAEKRVRTQVVLARLTELNPAEYEDWTFHDLAVALVEYEIEPAKWSPPEVRRGLRQPLSVLKHPALPAQRLCAS